MAQLTREDKSKLVRPLQRSLVVGQLEEGENVSIDDQSNVLLHTTATSSIATSKTKQDIIKVQQPHMFTV